MKIQVFMWAFENGKVRVVTVPANILATDEDGAALPVEQLLELVFKYGQNDFQPQQICSVSIGDVALVGNEFWCCDPVGWNRMSVAEYGSYVALPEHDRTMSRYKKTS